MFSLGTNVFVEKAHFKLLELIHAETQHSGSCNTVFLAKEHVVLCIAAKLSISIYIMSRVHGCISIASQVGVL